MYGWVLLWNSYLFQKTISLLKETAGCFLILCLNVLGASRNGFLLQKHQEVSREEEVGMGVQNHIRSLSPRMDGRRSLETAMYSYKTGFHMVVSGLQRGSQ